jgi:hypothetical protein
LEGGSKRKGTKMRIMTLSGYRNRSPSPTCGLLARSRLGWREPLDAKMPLKPFVLQAFPHRHPSARFLTAYSPFNTVNQLMELGYPMGHTSRPHPIMLAFCHSLDANTSGSPNRWLTCRAPTRGSLPARSPRFPAATLLALPVPDQTAWDLLFSRPRPRRGSSGGLTAKFGAWPPTRPTVLHPVWAAATA